MNGKGTVRIFALMAAGLLCAVSAQATLTLDFRRNYDNQGSSYPHAGGVVYFELMIEATGTGSLLSLSVSETIPAGWTFNSLQNGGAGLFVQPSAGATGTLDFVWLTPPSSFPFVLSYSLNVPAGDSGDKVISGSGAYNGGTPSDTNWGPLDTTLVAQVQVPDVIGMTVEQAEPILLAAGFIIGNTGTACSNTIAAESIISTEPNAGDWAQAGDIYVVVSTGPCLIEVPDVVGMLQDAATQALTTAGFAVGNVTQEYSDEPSGTVLAQSPLAGSMELPGASIDLTVSMGPCLVSTPNVVGMTQANAETALESVGLSVGNTGEEYSDTVAQGSIIEQSPAGGTEVACGIAVDLLISKGPCLKSVPNVVGNSSAVAQAALTSAQFTIGDVTEAYSDTVAVGYVVSQNPAGNTNAPCNSSVSLVISKGPEFVPVPNVVNQVESAARNSIAAALLAVGTVTQEYSDTTPAGQVIRQTPSAGTSVHVGSTVNLVVSRGPCRSTVPNVTGVAFTQAQTAITGASLAVGAVSQEYSETVEQNVIIRQSPAANTDVACGSFVNIVVSRGPCRVNVPNVVGSTLTSATVSIQTVGLAVGTTTEEYSETVAEGNVISQTPLPNAQVACDTTVDLVVSQGPCRVTVPNVLDRAQATANTIILSWGLVPNTTSQEYSETVAAGNVISQSPVSGTSVACGSTVNIVISRGPCRVTVPNVAGKTFNTAVSDLTGVGLEVGAVTQEYSETVAQNSVISQNPAANARVACASSVALVVSRGPCRVSTPSVTGMSLSAAQAALTAAGLTAGATTQECSDTVASGDVIRQTPVSGTSVACNSAVALVIATGPCPVTVPNIVGQTSGAAQTALVSAGLAVGSVTQQCSDTVEGGRIISQNPASGTSVSRGTAVNVVVSSGPCPVAVPNVTGMTSTAAQSAITAAELAVGDITEECSNTVAAGTVIRQNPAATTMIAPGSPVALVVSSGPCTIAVPNLVGLTSAAAQTTLTTAGFVAGQVTEQCSSTVPGGSIISQDPAAGTMQTPGTAIAVVVSTGLCTVSVPSLTGLTVNAASSALTGAGLTLGQRTDTCSNTVAAGLVISQTPASGATVTEGSAIAITVSSGPCPVNVPVVTGLSASAAESALVAAGLAIGQVTQSCSDTVAGGNVISQNPAGGAQALFGSAVSVVVSTGLCPVEVPDVTGEDAEAAASLLEAAGFVVGEPVYECTDAVANGLVFAQDPEGGQEALPGSEVLIGISTGPCPVAVPDLAGSLGSMAQMTLAAAKLRLGQVTQECSNTVAAGLVIRQEPAAGVEVAPNTQVNIVISTGVSCGNQIPNVVGMNQLSALAALNAAGFSAGTVTFACSNTVAANAVMSQEPAAGTQAEPGAVVALVFSNGPCTVEVPELGGLTQDEAQAALREAWLRLGAVTGETSETVPAGQVIRQNPPAGTSVAPNSEVTVVISLGGCVANVPDLTGLDLAAAAAAIEAAGFEAGNVSDVCNADIPEGHVAMQYPASGTMASCGTEIEIGVSSGPCVVPNGEGMTLEAFQAMLEALGLVLGDVTYEFSDTVAAGNVIRQFPPAGSGVSFGDAIDIVISLGSGGEGEGEGECLEIVLPPDGSTVFAPVNAPYIPLVLGAESNVEGGLGELTFGLDNELAGTVAEPPYLALDVNTAGMPLGLHDVSAYADYAGQPQETCQTSSAFTLASLPAGADADGNGLPDAPFALLADTQDTWVNFVRVPQTGRDRTIAVAAWRLTAADASKADGRLPVVVRLHDAANPDRALVVMVPRMLLTSTSDLGLVIVETAPDLVTLLGATEAAKVAKPEPGQVVAGGQYVQVSVVISQDGGATFAEAPASRLAMQPVHIALEGLAVATESPVSFFGYPTFAVNDPAVGLAVRASRGVWSGDSIKAQAVSETAMSANLVRLGLVVPYIASRLILSAVPAEGGSVTATPPGPGYEMGREVDLVATANAGWRFDHWEGSVLNPSSATTRIRMNGEQTVSAHFVRQFALTLSVQGEGTITPRGARLTYDEGALVSLSATPKTGWRFDHWNGDVFNPTAAQTRIRMTSDQDVTAVFTQITHTLTVLVRGEGTVTPAAGDHVYNEGEVVPLKARATDGWKFDGWEGHVANLTTDATTITMDADHTVIATFKKIADPARYLLTIDVSPAAGGFVTASPSGGTYYAGAVVTISATANPNYKFVRWEGPVANAQSASTTVTMTANVNVKAVFEKKKQPCGCLGNAAGLINGAGPGAGSGLGDGLALALVSGVLLTLANRPKMRLA